MPQIESWSSLRFFFITHWSGCGLWRCMTSYFTVRWCHCPLVLQACMDMSEFNVDEIWKHHQVLFLETSENGRKWLKKKIWSWWNKVFIIIKFAFVLPLRHFFSHLWSHTFTNDASILLNGFVKSRLFAFWVFAAVHHSHKLQHGHSLHSLYIYI